MSGVVLIDELALTRSAFMMQPEMADVDLQPAHVACIFELGSLLEAVCFHESMVAVMDPSSANTNAVLSTHLVRGLQKGKILKIVSPEYALSDAFDLGPSDELLDVVGRFFGDSVSSDELLMSISNSAKVPLLRRLRLRKDEQIPRPPTIRLSNDLLEVYDAIKRSTREDVEALAAHGSPTRLYTPPILSIALGESKSPPDILKVTLRLRRKMKRVRKAFREYEAAIADDSRSIRESLRALEDLRHVNETVADSLGSSEITNVAEWRDLASAFPQVERPSDLSPSRIIDLLLRAPAGAIERFLRRRNALYVLDVKNRFWGIRNYSRLIDGVYGHVISEADTAYLAELGDLPDAALDVSGESIAEPNMSKRVGKDVPRVFVSYSHDSSEHKRWVRDLAAALRARGVDAILDQWDVSLGSDLAAFMERITSSGRVLVICTDAYIRKANEGSGGVGFEKQIMTAELLDDLRSTKCIPVVRDVTGTPKVPTFLRGRLYVDFSEEARFDEKLIYLLREIHQKPSIENRKPPIGSSPF